MNNSLDFIDDEILSTDELLYVEQALKLKTPIFRISEVLAQRRIGMYILQNLVFAMENKEHIVYPLPLGNIHNCYSRLETLIIGVVHDSDTEKKSSSHTCF